MLTAKYKQQTMDVSFGSSLKLRNITNVDFNSFGKTVFTKSRSNVLKL